jgi:hypothetical protein
MSTNKIILIMALCPARRKAGYKFVYAMPGGAIQTTN